jgi:hypothetical protein
MPAAVRTRYSTRNTSPGSVRLARKNTVPYWSRALRSGYDRSAGDPHTEWVSALGFLGWREAARLRTRAVAA